LFSKIGQKKVFIEILEQIKRLIASGVLKPGDRLPSERQMVEELGVSRAAIREAIRALELMGLVRCVQGEGNFLIDNLDQCLVEPLSIMFMLGCKDVRQVQQLRHGLENKTAGLAAVKSSEQDVLDLEDLCVRIKTEMDEGERAALDRKLHYTIAELAGNPLITSTLNASSSLVESLIADIWVNVIGDKKCADAIDRQHAGIVESIRSHDSDAAVRCMDEHMKYTEDLIERILQG
jgi:GntR family transcriptional repressor for pyruvate dehydrogenase complex